MVSAGPTTGHMTRLTIQNVWYLDESRFWYSDGCRFQALGIWIPSAKKELIIVQLFISFITGHIFYFYKTTYAFSLKAL